MKLIRVHIDIADDMGGLTRVNYQNTASYLTLFIGEHLRKLKLELGGFSRILFQEGALEDLKNSKMNGRIFMVSLSKDYKGDGSLSSAEDAHSYFCKKYIEGFLKVDSEFGLKLTPELVKAWEGYFSRSLEYETKLASKKIGSLKVTLLKRYRYDAFEVIARLEPSAKKGNVSKNEYVIYTHRPDPMLVYYNLGDVVIDENFVRVNTKYNTVLFEWDYSGLR